MQLMPSTYKAIQSARPEYGRIDDPEWNIAAGVMHDRYLWKLWSKQVSEEERLNYMFSSYNAGEGNVKRFGGIPPFKETRNYVKKVRNYEADFKERVDSHVADVADLSR